MGGFGSGNWGRKRRYEALEAVPELTLTNLPCLDHGTLYALPRDAFYGGGLAYTYLRSGNALALFVAGAEADHELPTVVQLEKTACHFGGVRSWLICPNQQCRRRVGSLFVKRRVIACRHCHGLVFESQYGGEAERALGKIRKHHRLLAQGKVNRRVDINTLHQLYSTLLLPLQIIERGDT